jgi:hypothetical protein
VIILPYQAMVLSAYEDGKSVGIITITPQLEVRDLFVDSAYQNRGYGEKLSLASNKFIHDSQPMDAIVTIWTDNEVVKKYVKRDGGIEVAPNRFQLRVKDLVTEAV